MSQRLKSLLGWSTIAAVFGIILGSAVSEYLVRQQVTENGFRIGADFTLVDQDGRPMTKRDFDSKALALFAGFAYCPDICPTTLTRMSSLMEKLGPDAEKIQVVLFSVDPERDTPAVLKSYLAAFSDRFKAITGTPEQVKTFARDFRIYFAKVPRDGGDYTMDHSAGVFLFREGGAFQGTLDLHEGDDVALKKLKLLVK